MRPDEKMIGVVEIELIYACDISRGMGRPLYS